MLSSFVENQNEHLLTGSEPAFDPKEWNSFQSAVEKANCYAYFLQDKRANDSPVADSFPQPGAYADRLNRRKLTGDWLGKILGKQANEEQQWHNLRVEAPHTCSKLVNAVLADNPSVLKSSATAKCPKHYYKGYAAVDSNAEDSDFHFWVQTNNGYWAHKPGQLDVTNKDSDGKLIVSPSTSNRGRYKDECGYFCVPSNDYKPTFAAGEY